MRTFALAGNPNSGKTTLFNALTGSTAHVGNWPGVTVDKREGVYKGGKEHVAIVDLPGIYSLSPYTPEEVIARNFILNEHPDGIINIVDATNLERNLYLTTQLLEMDVPVIIALNMMDEIRANGTTINIDEMEKELRPIAEAFLRDYTVGVRLRGLGVLKPEQAILAGAVGPMLRSCGIAYDARKLGYAAYNELEFEPVTASDGDSYARCEVRIHEIYQSFALIRQAISKIPEGPICVPVKGNPNGEYFMRIEQPRGEAIYYVKANGTKFLDRFRLRTPTTSNIPPMLELMKGCQLADVPLLILTIDPCISCTER